LNFRRLSVVKTNEMRRLSLAREMPKSAQRLFSRALKMLDRQEIYKTVLAELPMGVYLVDRDQRIAFWNRGAEEITGYLSQQTLGHHMSENFLEHVGEDNRRLEGPDLPLIVAMRDGKLVEARVTIRHNDGILCNCVCVPSPCEPTTGVSSEPRNILSPPSRSTGTIAQKCFGIAWMHGRRHRHPDLLLHRNETSHQKSPGS
jgi:PAS domain S-box-containing protein